MTSQPCNQSVYTTTTTYKHHHVSLPCTRSQSSIMSRSLRCLRSTPLLRSHLRPLLILSPRISFHRGQQRHFVGQVLGIIANPFETLRQLDESRKLLEQTRQVPPKLTSPPGLLWSLDHGKSKPWGV